MAMCCQSHWDCDGMISCQGPSSRLAAVINELADLPELVSVEDVGDINTPRPGVIR
jgi:hypothetical protein